MIGLILVTVVLAVVRPWETRSPAQQPVARNPAGASPVATAATGVPSAPAATTDPLIDAASSQMLCNAPQGWRLISMETDVLGNSRTMYGIEPSIATGPTDPSIPTAQLHATEMFGVGVCRPNPDGLRVADLAFNDVTVWSPDSLGAPTAVSDPYVLDEALFRLGEVYLGPPRKTTGESGAGSSAPSWQPGRYVIEIQGAANNGAALWIALDFASAQAAAGVPQVK